MTMKKLRFLGRFIDIPGMKRIITTHLFGMLYYASPVWLNEVTTFKILNTLNSIHYKGLRIAAKDYYTVLSRDRIDQIFNRVTPLQWMKYSNAKLALTLIAQAREGPPITSILEGKIYINDRNPNKIVIHDTSRLKIGRDSFHNRLEVFERNKFQLERCVPGYTKS